MKKFLIVLLVLVLGAGALLADDGVRTALRESIEYPRCPDAPETGKWYTLSPGGARNADGSHWRARIRFGSEDKLMIYLLGGGMVIDDYSAGQSYAKVGGSAFYYDNDLGVSSKRIRTGIAGNADKNPFRDWTILLIPYTTGDFHVGTQGLHRGGSNYAALMDMIVPRLGAPDELLIAGYSAGGFGAAMLADDILGRFPETENAVLCVDGALLVSDRWREILSDRWHAPQEIVSRTCSDNLTLDHLRFLGEKYGNRLKILFTASTRDGGLAKFQSYLDGGAYASTAEAGECYYRHLCETVRCIQAELPDAGVYIWDKLPFDGNPALTRHTILYSDEVFAPLRDETSIAEWILRAFSGEITSHGLELLQTPR